MCPCNHGERKLQLGIFARMRAMLLELFLLGSAALAEAFVIQTSHQHAATTRPLTSTWRVIAGVCSSQKDAPGAEAVPPGDESPSEAGVSASSEGEQSFLSSAKASGQLVADALLIVWSIAWQLVGAAFALGLVLNLCGYGYTFDLERGLEVNTLSELRKSNAERRFLREFAKDDTTPPSSMSSSGGSRGSSAAQ